MEGGEISGNKNNYGGGVYVSQYGTFNKTGGTIYGYDSPNNTNNNQATTDFGHAVYVEGIDDNNPKYRNTTVGTSAYLFYNGKATPPTATGWNTSSINVTIIKMNDWGENLLGQTVWLSVGQSHTFTVTEPTGNSYQWYVNGSIQRTNTSPSFTFYASTSGIYEVTVVVTKNGEKRAGSCQVIVK